MNTRTLDRDADLFDDPPCTFSADAFVRIVDRLLDRVGAMRLPNNMDLREAIAHGYLPRGTIAEVIAVEWGRHRPNAHHGR